MVETPAPRESTQRHQLTEVLSSWSRGNGKLADKAVPLVYAELRRLAKGLIRRERRGHTLQATALVNEVYLQLSHKTGIRFQNRAHFIGRVAHMMRRVLVDHARERNALKRGGGWFKVTLGAAESGPRKSQDLIALEDALLSLGRKDPKMVRLVELRYFGGLTLEETAEVLEISRASVVLAWRRAKVWLHRELSPAASSEG